MPFYLFHQLLHQEARLTCLQVKLFQNASSNKYPISEFPHDWRLVLKYSITARLHAKKTNMDATPDSNVAHADKDFSKLKVDDLKRYLKDVVASEAMEAKAKGRQLICAKKQQQ